MRRLRGQTALSESRGRGGRRGCGRGRAPKRKPLSKKVLAKNIVYKKWPVIFPSAMARALIAYPHGDSARSFLSFGYVCTCVHSFCV